MAGMLSISLIINSSRKRWQHRFFIEIQAIRSIRTTIPQPKFFSVMKLAKDVIKELYLVKMSKKMGSLQ